MPAPAGIHDSIANVDARDGRVDGRFNEFEGKKLLDDVQVSMVTCKHKGSVLAGLWANTVRVLQIPLDDGRISIYTCEEENLFVVLDTRGSIRSHSTEMG